MVESCSTYHRAPRPKTDRPIWESTDSPLAAGSAPLTWARNDVPRNIVPSRSAMMSMVVRAFCHSGGLKAGTPLATASVPVMAEQPSAKARMRRSSPNVSAGTWAGDDVGHVGCLAQNRAQHAERDQQQRAAQEDVGRAGEDRAALADAPQVDRHHEEDEQHDQGHGEGAAAAGTASTAPGRRRRR